MERLSGLSIELEKTSLYEITTDDAIESTTTRVARGIIIEQELIESSDEGMESRSVKRTKTFEALFIAVAPIFIHSLFPEKDLELLKRTVERLSPIIVAHPLFQQISFRIANQIEKKRENSDVAYFIGQFFEELKKGKGEEAQRRTLQIAIVAVKEALNSEENLITQVVDTLVDYIYDAKDSFSLKGETVLDSDPFISFLVKDFKEVHKLLSGYWTRAAITKAADYYKSIPGWVYKYVDIKTLIRNQISAFLFKSLFYYTGKEKVETKEQEELIKDCNTLSNTLFWIVDLYLSNAKDNHEVVTLFYEVSKVIFGKSSSKKDTRRRILLATVLVLENAQKIPEINKAVNQAFDIVTKKFMQ